MLNSGVYCYQPDKYRKISQSNFWTFKLLHFCIFNAKIAKSTSLIFFLRLFFRNLKEKYFFRKFSIKLFLWIICLKNLSKRLISSKRQTGRALPQKRLSYSSNSVVNKVHLIVNRLPAFLWANWARMASDDQMYCQK